MSGSKPWATSRPPGDAFATNAFVIYDLRACFGSNAHRGIGRYVEELAGALHQQTDRVAFVVPPDDPIREARFAFPVLPATNLVLRSLAAKGATIFHSGSLYEFPTAAPVIPGIVTELGLHVSATLYDVIPYDEPDRYQGSHELRAFYAQRAVLLRSCDVLLANSMHSIEQAVVRTGVARNRCHMVGAGVNERFAPAQGDLDADTNPSAAAPYLLFVGGNDPRKNGIGLVRGFALLPHGLRETHDLVFAGWLSEDHRRDLVVEAMRLGCHHRLRFTGEVDDDELVRLYQQAALTVFPSLNEGFGLPVAEAAACRRPTVTSNAASIPEILDLPESTFDPMDPSDIARLLRLGLVDESFRQRLVEAGDRAAHRWRWDRVAADAIRAWDGLGRTAEVGRTARNATPRAARRKLAFVGPFGGSPSAIGTYNERLVPALAEAFDLTCFVEKFWGEAPLGLDGRFPAEALDRHVLRGSFDEVLVTLGNSPFHLSSLMNNRCSRTHVWLHEAQLAEAHIGAANLMRCSPWSQRHLRTLLDDDGHGAEIGGLETDGGSDGLLDVERYRNYGIRLVEPAVREARSMIVSSQLAADICRSPQIGYTGPLLVLGLAFPGVVGTGTTSLTARSAATPPAGADIAILGWLSERKGITVAVEILRELRRTIPETRLVFIGRPNDGAAASLRSAATAASVADAVVVTGFLSDDALRARLATVRAGLRLGGGDDGQMSAAVLELAAAGIPVVTDVVSTGEPSPGILVMSQPTTIELCAALANLLTNDVAHAEASVDALSRAKTWTASDVVARLASWFIEVGEDL